MDIKDIIKKFDDDIGREGENRGNAEEDIAFARMGDQWPEQIKKERQAEGRPCLTINRMNAFIRQVVNDSKMNSPQIKVKPIDSKADVKTADILGGLIRNIEYASNSDVAYDTALEYAVTCSMGFFRVTTDYTADDEFTQDIRIKRITNPLSVVFDSYSDSVDGSDWNHAFVVDWITKEEYKSRFKVKRDRDIADFAGDIGVSNIDEGKGLVRIAEYWDVEFDSEKIILLNDGTIISETEFLSPHPDMDGMSIKDVFESLGVSVHKTKKISKRKLKHYICGADIVEEADWPGKYIPIVPVFGEEVFYNGKRYLKSLIRDAKDSQRMLNYWRTASTELVALAPKSPYIGPVGAFDTAADKWATANIKSHPYLEYDGAVSPQRQFFTGPPAGAIQEALNASDDIKSILGIYDASLGARSNETSGRAIMARQKEGDVSTFHFIDNLAKSVAHTGRILVDLIPKIYDTPRVVRVMGIDGKSRSVAINQQTQDQGIEAIYDLTVGKYDVAVDTGPSFTTQRAEIAAQMTDLIRTFPQSAPFVGDLIAKNLDWPDAQEIGRRLQAMLPPHLQTHEDEEGNQISPSIIKKINALTQQIQQMQQFIKENTDEFQKMKTENSELKLDKSLEQEKLSIDRYNAETNRIKVQIQAGQAVSGAILDAANASGVN